MSAIETETTPIPGIPEQTQQRLLQCLTTQPQLRAVWLFGSRAMGRQRPGSDIDLTLVAPTLRHELPEPLRRHVAQMGRRLPDDGRRGRESFRRWGGAWTIPLARSGRIAWPGQGSSKGKRGWPEPLALASPHRRCADPGRQGGAHGSGSGPLGHSRWIPIQRLWR